MSLYSGFGNMGFMPGDLIRSLARAESPSEQRETMNIDQENLENINILAPAHRRTRTIMVRSTFDDHDMAVDVTDDEDDGLLPAAPGRTLRQAVYHSVSPTNTNVRYGSPLFVPQDTQAGLGGFTIHEDSSPSNDSEGGDNNNHLDRPDNRSPLSSLIDRNGNHLLRPSTASASASASAGSNPSQPTPNGENNNGDQSDDENGDQGTNENGDQGTNENGDQDINENGDQSNDDGDSGRFLFQPIRIALYPRHTPFAVPATDPAAMDNDEAEASSSTSPITASTIIGSQARVASMAAARGSTSATPSVPETNPDPALIRALTLKSALVASSNMTSTKNRGTGRIPVEANPENILIKTLRAEHHMGWTDIANFLNEERLKRGEAQTCTQSSVYSRFVRNAPRVAAASGEVGFDPQDYMHLRHTQHYPNLDLLEGMSAGTLAKGKGKGKAKMMPMKRDLGEEDGEDETDEEDGITKAVRDQIRKRAKLAHEVQELETAERTETLCEAVAVVDKNFWVFVADEMERMTGKLYDPKVLESRFKGLGA